MNIKGITFYSYCLPLIHPLNMKGYLQYERCGLIVELTDEDNNKGYGDAAPFAGLHLESLQDIIKEGCDIAQRLNKMDAGSFSVNLENVISPSLQYALEWALLDLMACRKGILPSTYLNKDSQRLVPVNELLAGSTEEITAAATAVKEKNPHTVKIKVAGRPLQDDIDLVQKINDIFAGKVRLRLDANRGWPLEEAVLFARETANTNIEFVEEPLKDPFDNQAFYEKSGIRYGLDESLTDCSIEDIKSMNGIAAFIIKPSVIGSIKLIENWVDFAEVLNVKIVFSSTFESGIGLWSIAQMAAAFGKDTAHGLNTYHWLKEDVIIPSFSFENFQIKAEKYPRPFTLNKEILKLL